MRERRLSPRIATSDFLQDMVKYAWLHCESFRGTTDAELEAWLRKIVAGITTNASRYNHAQKRDVSREVSSAPEFEPTSVWGQAERQAEIAEMAEAVDRLDPDLRLVVLKHVFESKTYPVIAREMGVTASKVSRTYKRAIQELELALNGQVTT